MQIIVTPHEESPSGLRALALLLNSIASDRDGGKLPVSPLQIGSTAPADNLGNVDDTPPPPPPVVPGASTQSQTPPPGASAPQNFNGAELDANGLPWDERIHSSSKNKNQDGTWRYTRGGDTAVRATVEAELRAQVAGLPAGAAADIPPPPPPVTQQSDVPPPPPPVPEPTADAPPVGQVTMQEVFSRANKTPVEQRNQALELVGLASMTEFLKGVKTRPELADELNAALAAVSGDE